MTQDNNLIEMPSRSWGRGARPSVWTEIGEVQVSVNLFGHAKVHVVRRDDALRRVRWLLVLLLLLLAVALGWRGGFLPDFHVLSDAVLSVREPARRSVVLEDSMASAPVQATHLSEGRQQPVTRSSTVQGSAQSGPDTVEPVSASERPESRRPALRRDPQANHVRSRTLESTSVEEPPANNSTMPEHLPVLDSVAGSAPAPTPEPAVHPVETPKMVAPLQAPATPLPSPAVSQ